MKAALQLSVGQHLTLTPQLQQAIRLLQLSRLELEQEIQSALDSNLMLEVPEEETQEAQNESEMAVPNWESNFSLTRNTKNTSSDDNNLENYLGTSTSLRDHLVWQMRLAHFSDLDQVLGLAIIDAIDEQGFLQSSLEDIHSGLIRNYPELELDELAAILHYVQNFEPAGVGARDLRECLLIQLRQLDADTPWRSQAQHIIENHLNLLGQRNYKDLQKRTKIKADELKNILALIQTLNPRPGNAIGESEARYIVPDVLVRQHKGRWHAELNPESMPKIQINSHYAGLTKKVTGSSDKNLLRNHLQEARWFLKSLQSRNETLLKVANYIVNYQHAFFEHGDAAMKPLVLHKVAEAIGMHESTISRVTTQKYMHTARGIFELKYFFSSHVQTNTGGECSATAIRALIKQVIAEENAQRPLSDNKIAAYLKQQGINVARRTIAKYREALCIASSSERKQL